MDSFVRLSTLVHLTELELKSVEIDLDSLGQVRLIPMHCVRKLELRNIRLTGTNLSSVSFCHLIATIFSNVEEVDLGFYNMVRMTLPRNGDNLLSHPLDHLFKRCLCCTCPTRTSVWIATFQWANRFARIRPWSAPITPRCAISSSSLAWTYWNRSGRCHFLSCIFCYVSQPASVGTPPLRGRLPLFWIEHRATPWPVSQLAKALH